MKTLLLIDGSSYFYRAYHAMEPKNLRAPDGSPTGAVYGVLNMLRSLHKDYNAELSACVFDAKGPTFRDEWYPDYKANRPPMPDDLRCQIEPLHAAIEAAGWPLLCVPGVEADDVIGTLARQAEAAGYRVVISTGDKDMAQLVTERITLINTMNNTRMDEAGVAAKFGVRPDQIIDFLTLMGDKVDNVPGVEKCGEKTAAKWLNEYGTLDNLVANAAAVKGVVGENLRKAVDRLPLSRRLVTIKCDVELPRALDDLVASAPDTDALKDLYARLGFRSWLKELGGAAPAETPSARPQAAALARPVAAPPVPPADPAPAGRYTTVLSLEALAALVGRLRAADIVCIDTETTSLDAMQARLVGMSFAVAPEEGYYLPLAHRTMDAAAQVPMDAALALLKPVLEDAAVAKVGQNLKYDRHVLANHGIALAGINEDTYLQAYVLESHLPRGMDKLAERHLNYRTLTYEEVCGKGAKQIGFDMVDLDTATRYAAEDADITLRLHRRLGARVEGDAPLARVYRDIEMPALRVLGDMERHGVLLDTRRLAAQSHELGLRLVELERQAHALAGQPFNLNSPKQVGEILFDKLGLPAKKKTAGGAASTSEEVLSELALDYPLPKVLLDYRGLAKLKSTYTDALPKLVHPETGRVHTSYNQAGAVTGRLASSDPNLQNIPVRTTEGRRVREAFIAPPGFKIMAADYSQIELRIMAHLSDDPALLRAFAEGHDVHRATAAEIFGVGIDAVTTDQRRAAKAINFGLIYGMSAFGLARELDMERNAAQSYIDRYFARYPGVARYMQDTRTQAAERGFVETVFGRRLHLPDIQAGGPRRQAAERAAINAPMQGTAADIIKLAMVAVAERLAKENLRSRMIMQVHDELVLEVADDEIEAVRALLKETMAGVAALKVPLLVETGVGDNWEQAH